MKTPTMTVGGEPVESDVTFPVINPATGTAFIDAPRCTRSQLDDAFAAAEAAAPGWRHDLAFRRDVLRRAAKALEQAAPQIVPVLTAEQGKPLREAAAEVQRTGDWLNYYADLHLPREILQDDDAVFSELIHRPVGVVAAITPWNLPLVLTGWKLGPALLAGNTMVLKPSPYTPISTLMLGEVLREVVPPGVLNVVSGGDELGAWMTGHPSPRRIAFTGSTETGKRVAAAAAADLKRIGLELGGNDAAIILDDVEPATVADKIFANAFANNGQVCAGIKRVFVPARRHAALVEALSARARAARVGDGSVEGTELGPINNRPQHRRITDLVDEAVARGGRIAAGGRALPGDGYFFEPTIVTDVGEGTRLVDEEQFGPALPVLAYDTVDEAVARANGTPYGLCGSVWSDDVERAAEIAARLDCGTAWVNQHRGVPPYQPFGGTKWSGLGVENGLWGYFGYTEIQVLHRPKRKGMTGNG